MRKEAFLCSIINQDERVLEYVLNQYNSLNLAYSEINANKMAKYARLRAILLVVRHRLPKFVMRVK